MRDAIDDHMNIIVTVRRVVVVTMMDRLANETHDTGVRASWIEFLQGHHEPMSLGVNMRVGVDGIGKKFEESIPKMVIPGRVVVHPSPHRPVRGDN